MGVMVTTGASIFCTFGTAPANLTVTSQSTVLGEGKPAATIEDTTVSTCGMCSSMGNPQVASATAAALGILTPQPCGAEGGALTIGNPGQGKIII